MVPVPSRGKYVAVCKFPYVVNLDLICKGCVSVVGKCEDYGCSTNRALSGSQRRSRIEESPC